MSGVGGDGRAAGEVTGDGFPYGEDDVSSEAQAEDLLRRLAAFLAVVVGGATVAAGRDEPVAAAWLTRRGERGEHAVGARCGEVWPTAREGGSGDPAGEVGEAEANSHKGRRKCLCALMSIALVFRMLETTSSFLDGEPMPSRKDVRCVYSSPSSPKKET